MSKFRILKKELSVWWGFPLILGITLIPIAFFVSPALMMNGKVPLLFASLSVCLALLMLYDLSALPGIFIGLLIYYGTSFDVDTALLIATWYLFSLVVCWLGYRIKGNRSREMGFRVQTFTAARIFWLVLLLPILLVGGQQILVNYELLPDTLGLERGPLFNVPLVLNYLGVLLACLINIQLIYYLVRLSVHPHFFTLLLKRSKQEREPKVTWIEILIWLTAFIFTLMVMTTYPVGSEAFKSILGRPVSMLLPVIIYGAIRFGPIIIGACWTVACWVLLYSKVDIVKVHAWYFAGEDPQTESLYWFIGYTLYFIIVMTAIVIIVARLSTRQRRMAAKARYLSMTDPVNGLPNIRWLAQDLERNKESTLCFISVANLETLSRAYGFQVLMMFKQELAQTLKPVLASNELLYHLPGYDVVLRLNKANSEQTLQRIEEKMQQFHLQWNGMPLHICYGLGSCKVKWPVNHLNTLLAELSTCAVGAINQGSVQDIHLNYGELHSHLHNKVLLLQKIQRALDEDGFIIVVRPFVGVRGDCHYELKLNLPDEQKQQISLDKILPIAYEFGLTSKLDFWLLEKSMQFIHHNRQRLPGLRFVLTLSPDFFYQPNLLDEVKNMAEKYNIEPYQLTLSVQNYRQLAAGSLSTLQQLRQLGYHIAIDDFGSGYANYNRLKTVQADVLKIDGYFVQDLLKDDVNYCIVESLCRIARLKNMIIVAESVDTEEQREVLKNLGVEYLQGKLIGNSFLLSEL